jgi:hypothetical protein
MSKGTTVIWATTSHKHLRTLVRITNETRVGIKQQWCWFADASIAGSILDGTVLAQEAYMAGRIIKVLTSQLHHYMDDGLVYAA